jgi:hypothetical protein
VEEEARETGVWSFPSIVGHSLGAFTAPLVCARVPADLLILLSGMIPSPGELFDDWWKNAGYEQLPLTCSACSV